MKVLPRNEGNNNYRENKVSLSGIKVNELEVGYNIDMGLVM